MTLLFLFITTRCSCPQYICVENVIAMSRSISHEYNSRQLPITFHVIVIVIVILHYMSLSLSYYITCQYCVTINGFISRILLLLTTIHILHILNYTIHAHYYIIMSILLYP